MPVKKQILPFAQYEIHKAVDTLIDNVFAAQPIDSVTQSVSQQKKQLAKQELESNVIRFKDDCSTGLQLMLEELSSTLFGKEREQFTEEYQRFIHLMDTEKERNAFDRSLREGRTCKEALNLSQFFMSKLFQAAQRLYELEKYEQAIFSFLTLCWLDSKEYLFPMFLGFAYFAVKRFQDALYAYISAAPLAPDSYPFIYTAQCFLELGDEEKARLTAEKGLEEEKLCENPNPELISLFEQLLNAVKV